MVVVLAGCGDTEPKEPAHQAAVLEAIGDIAGEEVGLSLELRTLVWSYVNREQIKINLSSERDPGKVAVMSAELSETSAEHLRDVSAFEQSCKKIELLAKGGPDWTKEDHDELGKYSSPALLAVKKMQANQFQAIRAADVYLAAVRSGERRSEMHAWYLQTLDDLTR